MIPAFTVFILTFCKKKKKKKNKEKKNTKNKKQKQGKNHDIIQSYRWNLH